MTGRRADLDQADESVSVSANGLANTRVFWDALGAPNRLTHTAQAHDLRDEKPAHYSRAQQRDGVGRGGESKQVAKHCWVDCALESAEEADRHAPLGKSVCICRTILIFSSQDNAASSRRLRALASSKSEISG